MIHNYLVISLIAFGFWFSYFWQDQTTQKSDLESWLALLIVAISWPVAFPLSVWELARK